MSKIELLKLFLSQRLTEAAEEIFGAVELTLADYHEECSRTKEENDRLLKLLDVFIKPELKLHRIDLQHLTGFEKKELNEKWKPLHLGQKDPELTQINNEKEELRASQVREELHGLEEDSSPAFVENDCHQDSSFSSDLVSSPTEQINTGFDEAATVLPSVAYDKLTAVDDTATHIKEALPMCSTPATLRPILDALQDLGVETVDDMKFVEEDDLAGLLKPIQARKHLAHIKTQSDTAPSHLNREDFPSSPQPVVVIRRVTTSPLSISPSSLGSLISSPSDIESSTSSRQLGNNCLYNFQVPWNMLPAALNKKLANQERPTIGERREIIHIVASEILSTCNKPSMKHLSEVARMMVLAYPKSFKDIIEDEVIGSGYDSLAKQLRYRIDNCNRKKVRPEQKSTTDDCSTGPENKKQRKDCYGCIHWESRPVYVKEQMQKKKDMQTMYLENESHANKIEQLISDTFVSQRKDIRSRKDTKTLKEEWPYLFSLVGMKAHFKLLTGVHVDEGFEEAMATRFARVSDYFQSLPSEKSSGVVRPRSAEIQAGGGPREVVLMLLSHFEEDCAKMFHVVDKTAIADEIQREHLPPTPCVVICESPMSAAAYMLAADQTVIIEKMASFTDALVSLFLCYYIFDMRYPAELRGTMEFLQRCIFKINPNKGSKVQRQQKKKSNAVNSKVLSLISRISEFDWSA